MLMPVPNAAETYVRHIALWTRDTWGGLDYVLDS